jgi:hypothetical protein
MSRILPSWWPFLLGSLALSGCLVGVNPKAIPSQELFAQDGARQVDPGAIGFAVVGDTRDSFPGDRALGRVPTVGAEKALVADVGRVIDREGLRFVAFTGNMVSRSATSTWKTFNHDWLPVLLGSELGDGTGTRIRVVPAAGVGDRAGDERLRGWGAAFPGVGADIGFGRIASWYHFDLETKGVTWRMVVLDSDKQHLGSRWEEQIAWIGESLKLGRYDSVIVLMNQPLYTLALQGTSNQGEGPMELLDAVDNATPLGARKLVFAGQSGANEVFLPGGKFGELYVNVVSGAPVASFARWGKTEGLGADDLHLEAMYDLALLKALDRWVEAKGGGQGPVDKARAKGDFTGFVGTFDAGAFPLQGWWDVALNGDQASLTFRAIKADETVGDLYTAKYQGKEGWRIGGGG